MHRTKIAHNNAILQHSSKEPLRVIIQINKQLRRVNNMKAEMLLQETAE